MPISEWADLMQQTIVREPVTGRDAYGAPTFGSPISYKCRVVYRTTRVRALVNGQDVMSAVKVWIAGVLAPQHDDRFTLPNGQQPVLLTYETFDDPDGDHHTKLYFGGAQFGGQRG